ncbi:hypothetical protein JEZ13_05780 [bacterium]|nr:hypothetical protein [bacterium]
MEKNIALHSSLMTLDKAKKKIDKFYDNLRDYSLNNFSLKSSLSLNLNNRKTLYCSQIIENYSADFSVIFILTGGVESIAQDIINKTKKKVLLIGLENDNSLPACYELKSFNDKEKVELLYFGSSQKDYAAQKFMERMQTISKCTHILNYFRKINIGIIGGISDWLLNSQAQAFPPEFDINLVNIDFQELLETYESTPTNECKPLLKHWKKIFQLKGIDPSELEKSARVYYALFKIIKKYKLSAFTIKCFDLLPHQVTACLALAEFNSHGVAAGCEGDTQALFTSIFAMLASDYFSWMANISDINIKDNTIQLAHCTVPLNFLVNRDNIALDTHMESGLSLAVCGDIRKSDVTLIRIGKSMSDYSILEGEIIDSNMGNKNICRTQILVKVKDTDNWYDRIIGNHQILVREHHKEQLEKCLKNLASN